jgi:hypothetical protein
MEVQRRIERMAKLKANAIIESLSGSLGKDLYVRTTKDGRMIISQKPDFSNRQFSEAQLGVQERTRQAAAYARLASKENPIYAQKAKGTSLNAYNVASRDWRRPPVIDSISVEHGNICVRAHDDVTVCQVTLSILDEAGQLVEQGEAELKPGNWWEYQATNSGLIRVEARDLPGNITRQEFHPSSQSDCWDHTSQRQEPAA